jgi:hypothetical protein
VPLCLVRLHARALLSPWRERVSAASATACTSAPHATRTSGRQQVPRAVDVASQQDVALRLVQRQQHRAQLVYMPLRAHTHARMHAHTRVSARVQRARPQHAAPARTAGSFARPAAGPSFVAQSQSRCAM